MAEADARWTEAMDAGVAQLVHDLVLAHESCAAHSAGSMRVLTEALAPAPDRLHAAVLATRLLAAARSLVERLHASHDEMRRTDRPQRARPRCTCADAAWSRVAAFAIWPDGDPRSTFAEWLDAFFTHFDHEHPRTPGARAAQLVRLDPVRAWRMKELAGRLDISPAALNRQFREQFGLRIPEYVHLARASRAVALFGTATKVEAIAWEVGYRSKKDLYAALKRWVDATPTELRALTNEERGWLEEKLRERMSGRVVLGAGF